jgi:N-acetylmuramoyl-L-alanine amidase
MNKIKVLIAVLFISSGVFAQSLSGYKICIDPGHGGNDPANDRWIPEAGFWESEGNLTKGLYLKEILEELGAEVIITRTGNKDSDDLPLSQRAGIANANNADFFHSIHSNATGTSNRANFPLMLFRGYDNNPVFPEAKSYGIIVHRKILDSRSGTWSYTSSNVRGDWSFYPSWGTSGLGVLRPLSMPGLLSEGSFHDYIPEAKRLKNDMYLKHESWAIARAFLDHFGGGSFTTGIVAGILRDPNENVPSSYQPLTSADSKRPLNQVKATLLPLNLEYIGDDFDNGYFMFDELDPGSYQLILEATDYKPDTVDVNIIAHRSVFANRNLELIPNENAPTVVTNHPQDATEEVSTLTEIVVEFDIRMNITSAQNAFSIQPGLAGEFRWENDSRRMIFTPDAPLQAGTEYTVTISTDAKTQFDVNLAAEHKFNFTTKSKLNIISLYPNDGEEDVSTTVLIRIQFDEAIQAASLPGNVLFYDKNDSFINIIVNTNAYSSGIIEFYPRDPLPIGEDFKIILKNGISDLGNVELNEERTIIFTTERTQYTDGNILDDFESVGTWLQRMNQMGPLV